MITSNPGACVDQNVIFQRREMDGFDARKSVVIGATNRKSDLDAALLSRFNMVRISLCCWSLSLPKSLCASCLKVVTFGLPEEDERLQILFRFARHLTREELKTLAEATAGLSGRDLRDIAENTERRWASKVGNEVRGVADYLAYMLSQISCLSLFIQIIRGEVKDGSLPSVHEYMESATSRQSTHSNRSVLHSWAPGIM